MCVSGIEIHTKFGMGAQLYKGQVISYVSAPGVDPRGQGGPKQGLESIYSRNRETRKIFYKTKVVGKVCFSGGRSYFWARNPDPEGPGPHVLLEPWSSTFRQSLLHKSCSVPSQLQSGLGFDPYTYPFTLTQGNFVASNHPHTCEWAKRSSHVMR